MVILLGPLDTNPNLNISLGTVHSACFSSGPGEEVPMAGYNRLSLLKIDYV